MQNLKKVKAKGDITLWLVLLNAVILKEALISNENWYLALILTLPLLLLSVLQEQEESITILRPGKQALI